MVVLSGMIIKVGLDGVLTVEKGYLLVLIQKRHASNEIMYLKSICPSERQDF